MKKVHISYGVAEDCKNPEESYGEICIRCNKCRRWDKEIKREGHKNESRI